MATTSGLEEAQLRHVGQLLTNLLADRAATRPDDLPFCKHAAKQITEAFGLTTKPNVAEKQKLTTNERRG